VEIPDPRRSFLPGRDVGVGISRLRKQPARARPLGDASRLHPETAPVAEPDW